MQTCKHACTAAVRLLSRSLARLKLEMWGMPHDEYLRDLGNAASMRRGTLHIVEKKRMEMRQIKAYIASIEIVGGKNL